MSDVSFPISVPPIPTPNVSPDEGVPGIPEAGVYSNGSYGNSSIGLDAPEAFTPHQIGYEANVLSGIEIIWADQGETFISASDILEDYDSDNDDYWSVVFAVSNNAFTQATPTYDSTQDLWNDTGTDQTVYRLRVKTLNGDSDPTSISTYGQYRETIICVNGEPVTSLVKIT